MLELLVANVSAAQEVLPVPLALENVATLLDWPHPEMDEATFLTEVLERTGALLLLDIANVHANARNHGWDPLAYLDRIPLDRVAYVHIAGGVEREGLYHDTHAHPIASPVFELLEELAARTAFPASSWNAMTAFRRRRGGRGAGSDRRGRCGGVKPAGGARMTPEDRERLGTRQAELVAGATGRAEVPEGSTWAGLRRRPRRCGRSGPGRWVPGPPCAVSGQ